MTNPNNKKSIAVIGGGITGIAAALALAESGAFEVSLFEEKNELGGLCGSFQWENAFWDRFYHVLLSTDIRMLGLIETLGLSRDLVWRDAQSGFYGNGRFASMSTMADFIRFPFLSLWQKARLGFGILYSISIKDPSKLDRVSVRSWLIKVFGRKVYHAIWEPLLRSKLGAAHERTSAAFIWVTITRLYGTRHGKDKKEKMGYVKGGFHAVMERAERKLIERGVAVRKGEKVTSLERGAKEGRETALTVTTTKGRIAFDKALFTIDSRSVAAIVRHPGEAAPYWSALQRTDYLGIVCVTLMLNRSLSNYYVLNLLDKNLPFTGIIESTNILLSDDAGKHAVYLPKYMPSDDPFFSLTDAEIISSFIEGLKKVFPDLRDENILYRTVSRERFIQPVRGLGYLDRTLVFSTPTPDVYIANTSMIVDSTLNNDSAIACGRSAAGFIASEENK